MKFTFAPEARPLDGYTIKRAIHRGGFGEVYYALSDAGKEVALKLLNNNLDVELRGVSQCLNLKHANLVTIFDIRQDADDDHWVVMEYVSGRGLYETLQNYPDGMPVQEVLDWLDGMAAGLSFLHDRGIVHRDLKPANVFRDHGGVKIGDVGLSKYISESRRSAQTQSVGTVYYMAPEVARGRYGREVDVYALGIMLYEMLTGTVPFDGQTTAEILMKHLTADPDLSVLPESLRSVIASALEKDPDQRTRSVEDLEHQFRSAVAGVDVSAPLPRAKSIPVATSVEPETVASAGASVQSSAARAARPEADTVVDIDIDTTGAKKATGFGGLAALWASIPTPLQWVIGGTAALLVIESGLLRQVAVGGMIGGVAYLAYQMVQVVTGGRTKPDAGIPNSPQPARRPRRPPQPPLTAAEQRRRQMNLDKSHLKKPEPAPANYGRRYTPATVRTLSKRQRATDISTSISVSLAASGLVTLAVFLTTNLLTDMSQAVYFAVITMLASWALIVPAKVWEGRAGDNFTRRLTLGAVGLGIGYIAAVLPEYLLISNDSLFKGAKYAEPHLVGRVTLADGSGFPTVACFMIFFGALFFIRRWWWQIDSFRSSRFRVTSALFTLLVGVVITGVLQEFSFPDALGATWALAISAVVQLSAGWTPAEDRRLQPTPEPMQKPTPETPEQTPQLAAHEAASLKNA